MKDVSSITAQNLNMLRQNSEPVHLVDVRSTAEYRAGHIEGSISIPLDELNPESLAQQLKDTQVGHDQTLYLTCLSGTRSQQAAEQLNQSGLSNIKLLEGGTEAWLNASLPTERCGNAISLERQVQITIGTLLVLKVIFGFTINELFFIAIPFIGAGLIFAGITRWCGMARLMALMPWNQTADCSKKAAA